MAWMNNAVKIIKTHTWEELENKINEFIKDKCVYDIRHTHLTDRYGDSQYTAMIWYMSQEGEEEGLPSE